MFALQPVAEWSTSPAGFEGVEHCGSTGIAFSRHGRWYSCSFWLRLQHYRRARLIMPRPKPVLRGVKIPQHDPFNLGPPAFRDDLASDPAAAEVDD
jgi:hypothetical protein